MLPFKSDLQKMKSNTIFDYATRRKKKITGEKYQQSFS